MLDCIPKAKTRSILVTQPPSFYCGYLIGYRNEPLPSFDQHSNEETKAAGDARLY